MLPSKEVLLAAATRGDWRAVLGLGKYEQLTEKAARNFRVRVHPDKGGDPEVAKVAGQALEALLEDARGQQSWWEEEQERWRERRREQERMSPFNVAITEWKRRWEAWEAQIARERPINASSPANREWLQRSTKFHQIGRAHV